MNIIIGQVTNRTGQLLDLRFDSEKGFTFVTREELESGLTQSSRTKSKKQEPVRFLFQAGNKVSVTWGTVSPASSRTRTFQIGSCNYTTNASGGQLVVQTYDLSADMGRLKIDQGKTFTYPDGQTPESLKQVLYRIARVFNARLIFDKAEVTSKPVGTNVYIQNRTEIGGDTAPAQIGVPITFTNHVGLHQQVQELAELYSSAYEIYDDPILGIPVIEFTSLSLRYPEPVRTLTYRDQSGTVLEVQYTSLDGIQDKSSSSTAIDEQGQAQAEYVTVALTDKADTPVQSFKPDTDKYQENAKRELGRNLVGDAETTPSTDKNVIEQNNDNKSRASSFMGMITVKTVGNPDLRPDLMRVEGIGARASTDYRFFQVTHSLSSSGYTCTLQGKSQTVGEGGVDNKEQEKNNEEWVIRQLSTPKA